VKNSHAARILKSVFLFTDTKGRSLDNVKSALSWRGDEIGDERQNQFLPNESSKGRPNALLFGRNASLFEVEFALDAPARFVGDMTVAQELVDVFAFQGDQIGAHVRRCRSRIVLAQFGFWQSSKPVIVTGAQYRQGL
jgi:hypothetical protein